MPDQLSPEIERISNLAAFGIGMLRWLMDHDIFIFEESEEWCEIMQDSGFIEHAIYDPERHGQISDAEPGQEVWIFTNAARVAIGREVAV